MVSPVRLGAVSYLNAAPLVYGLAWSSRVPATADLPSKVAEGLHAGTIDVGMIPSIEYARGEYAIVPGIAIGSRGPVRSVSLYLRGKLDQVRRVALDTSSRTSVALARILLRERLGRDPEYVDRPPDLKAMLAEADAALVIGDPALYADHDAERLDLGEGWQDPHRPAVRVRVGPAGRARSPRPTSRACRPRCGPGSPSCPGSRCRTMATAWVARS